MAIFEGLTELDLNELIDNAFSLGYKIVRIPFGWWVNLPGWVHWTVGSLIVLFAIFMALLTWKYRDAWRNRA